MILETNANGELEIPAGVLGAGPHVRFRVEKEGPILRLVPEGHVPEVTPSAAIRAKSFHDWVLRLPKRNGPGIPTEALRRENFYD